MTMATDFLNPSSARARIAADRAAGFVETLDRCAQGGHAALVAEHRRNATGLVECFDDVLVSSGSTSVDEKNETRWQKFCGGVQATNMLIGRPYSDEAAALDDRGPFPERANKILAKARLVARRLGDEPTLSRSLAFYKPSESETTPHHFGSSIVRSWQPELVSKRFRQATKSAALETVVGVFVPGLLLAGLFAVTHWLLDLNARKVFKVNLADEYMRLRYNGSFDVIWKFADQPGLRDFAHQASLNKHFIYHYPINKEVIVAILHAAREGLKRKSNILRFADPDDLLLRSIPDLERKMVSEMLRDLKPLASELKYLGYPPISFKYDLIPAIWMFGIITRLMGSLLIRGPSQNR